MQNKRTNRTGYSKTPVNIIMDSNMTVNSGIKSFLNYFSRVIILIVLGLVLPLSSKEIPWNKYIQHMPLNYPKIITQTEASKILALYGDKNDPAYRDVDPADGIDDHRFKVLEKIAVRFAPYLMQNTSSAPMDFKYFMKNPEDFPLYIDTWDISLEKPALIQSQSINFAANDSQLLSLLKEFHPDHPTNKLFCATKKNVNAQLFKVLFFNFPGHDEKSWKKEYKKQISKIKRQPTLSFIKTYVHPFISDERAKSLNISGYEFIIQYWFFYPHSDGGNNHEGDWEHINVAISPLEKIEKFLSANDVKQILQGKGLSNKYRNEQLVIKRIEYYFHYKVMTLDFAHPNVYSPKNEWKQETKSLKTDRRGMSWIWRKIRSMAYRDAKETKINTHPIGYIGGDCRGYDQILALPGGKNRDSHGIYPFRGVYRSIGPAGASEQISTQFDHIDYYKSASSKKRKKKNSYGNGHVIRFDDPFKIKIIPDWERVIELAESNTEARIDWFWLVLPIRWGYPASSSPFAGIIAHMDSGNLASLGPAYMEAWNRVSGCPGYAIYAPHKFSSFFTLDWQSNFNNKLGLLNAVWPTFTNIPPFDLGLRILTAPLRVFKHQAPVFLPKKTVPSRFVGFSAGVFQQNIPEEFASLLFSPDQIMEIKERIIGMDPHFQNINTKGKYIIDKANGMMFQVAFHMGKHLISENTLRHSRSTVGEDIDLTNRAEPFKLRSKLNLWEYSGSLRFNLATGYIQPFVKAGYGLSWYRLENVTADGQPLEQPHSPWIRKPSLTKLKNILPNTLHLGLGIEVLPIKSLKGVDVGFRLEYLNFRHSIGLEFAPLPWYKTTKGGFVRVNRRDINLSLTLIF